MALNTVFAMFCPQSQIDLMRCLKFSRVESLLEKRSESEGGGQAMEGLEIQNECNFCSILFCVWFKLAALTACIRSCLGRDGCGSSFEHAGWLWSLHGLGELDLKSMRQLSKRFGANAAPGANTSSSLVPNSLASLKETVEAWQEV